MGIRSSPKKTSAYQARWYAQIRMVPGPWSPLLGKWAAFWITLTCFALALIPRTFAIIAGDGAGGVIRVLFLGG